MAEQVGAVELLAELLGANDAIALRRVVLDLPGDQALAVGGTGVVAFRRPEQPLLFHAQEGEKWFVASRLPDAHAAIVGGRHHERIPGSERGTFNEAVVTLEGLESFATLDL